LYSAEEFGEFATLTAVAILLGNFATLRMEAAIPVAEDNEVAALARLGFYCTVVVATAFALTWAALELVFDILLLGQPFATFGLATTLSALAIAWANVMTRLHVRDSRYTSIGVQNAVQGIAQAASQVALGALVHIFNGMLYGLLIGRAVGLATHSRTVASYWRRQPRLALRQVAIRYKRDALVSSWSATLGSAGLHVPVIIIGVAFSAGSLGIVALAQRVLALPVQLIAQSVENVVQGDVGAAVRARNRRVLPEIKRILVPITFVVLVPACVSIPVAPWFFAAVFGDAWAEAGTIYQILVIPTALQILAFPLGAVLPTIGLHGRRAAWDVMRTALTIGAIAITIGLDGDLRSTLIAFAAAQIASYCLMVALAVQAIIRYDRLETAGRQCR
jgi:O-antigen/teichoic acid export membrane protein